MHTLYVINKVGNNVKDSSFTRKFVPVAQSLQSIETMVINMYIYKELPYENG